jgi:hypothetical protein
MSGTAFDDQFSSPPPEGILVSDNTKFPAQKALPCPFCGAQMNVTESGHLGHPNVKCATIALLYLASGHNLPEGINMLELWNTRVKQ